MVMFLISWILISTLTHSCPISARQQEVYLVCTGSDDYKFSCKRVLLSRHELRMARGAESDEGRFRNRDQFDALRPARFLTVVVTRRNGWVDLAVSFSGDSRRFDSTPKSPDTRRQQAVGYK